MRKAAQSGDPLAVAVLDVDHFKTVNDLHGHDEGDRVLVALGDMLRSQAAGRGLAARHGGEEFVIPVSYTHLDGYKRQGGRLRHADAVSLDTLAGPARCGRRAADPG